MSASGRTGRGFGNRGGEESKKGREKINCPGQAREMFPRSNFPSKSCPSLLFPASKSGQQSRSISNPGNSALKSVPITRIQTS
jgi:hypothetical protein